MKKTSHTVRIDEANVEFVERCCRAQRPVVSFSAMVNELITEHRILESSRIVQQHFEAVQQVLRTRREAMESAVCEPQKAESAKPCIIKRKEGAA